MMLIPFWRNQKKESILKREKSLFSFLTFYFNLIISFKVSITSLISSLLDIYMQLHAYHKNL